MPSVKVISRRKADDAGYAAFPVTERDRQRVAASGGSIFIKRKRQKTRVLEAAARECGAVGCVEPARMGLCLPYRDFGAYHDCGLPIDATRRSL